MKYPLMFRLRQKLRGPTIDDIPAAIESELTRLCLGSKVRPGNRIAVACGPPPMANHAAIVKAVIAYFKRIGAHPFLVPAVGRHEAETDEDQRRALQVLGITEDSVGAKIRSSMQTEAIGQLPEGWPVHFDQNALRADYTVVLSRVSLHPMLHGDVQYGLLETIGIGLGKPDRSRLYDLIVEDPSFSDFAYGTHEVVLTKANLLAGLMIVQNSHQSTARIQAVLPENFVEKEKAMLKYARGLLRLPFKFIDILLIDEIGKDFYCVGADLNVIGRKYHAHASADAEFPRIRTIVFRDLNENSKGDAVGVGHAEFVRSQLLRKMDAQVTRARSLRMGIPSLAATPIDFETDREILDVALSVGGSNLPEKARIVWIRNTSSVADLECSESYLEEVQHWKDLSVLSELHSLEFDSQGNLRNFVVE